MKIKSVILYSLVIFCAQSYAAPAPFVPAVIPLNLHATHDEFTSRKFDYIFACDVSYQKVREYNYEYFCRNAPQGDLVLFMTTTFTSDGWPTKIMYYMKNK